MSGFDIPRDQKQPSGSDTNPELFFCAMGQPGRRRRDGDDSKDAPPAMGLLQRLREKRANGEHPLRDALRNLFKEAPKLQPLIDFISGITDLKFGRDGKGTFSVSIKRDGATSIPFEDKSNPLFKPKSIELAKEISFDFSLKDGLTNMKGFGVRGDAPIVGEKTVSLTAAKLTTKDKEPALEVQIEGVPITIPLKKLMDKK